LLKPLKEISLATFNARSETVAEEPISWRIQKKPVHHSASDDYE